MEAKPDLPRVKIWILPLRFIVLVYKNLQRIKKKKKKEREREKFANWVSKTHGRIYQYIGDVMLSTRQVILRPEIF